VTGHEFSEFWRATLYVSVEGYSKKIFKTFKTIPMLHVLKEEDPSLRDTAKHRCYDFLLS